MSRITPIHLVENEESFNNVTDPFCFLIGSNGVFIKKENIIFKVIQPYFTDDKRRGIPGLFEIEPKSVVTLTRMTQEFVDTFLDFFRWCFEEHKAEGFLYLYFNPKTAKYHVIPAEQEVSGASVHYGAMPDPPKGFKVIGTMHSHGSMGAFHSGTDHTDQTELDGIHITVGKVNTSPEYSIKLYVNGKDYNVKEELLIPGLKKKPYSFPNAWKSAIKEKTIGITVYGGSENWGNTQYGRSFGFVNQKKDLGPKETANIKEEEGKNVRNTFESFVNETEKDPSYEYRRFETVSKTAFDYSPAGNKVQLSAWGANSKEHTKVFISLEDWKKMPKVNKIEWLVKNALKLYVNTVTSNKLGSKSNEKSKVFNPEEAFNFGMNIME